MNNVRNRLARVVLDFFGDWIVRHHETAADVADGVHEKSRDACSGSRHGNQRARLIATLIVDDELFALVRRTCARKREIFGVRDPDRPVRPNALHHGQDVADGVAAVSAVRDRERNDTSADGRNRVDVDHHPGSRTAGRRRKSDYVILSSVFQDRAAIVGSSRDGLQRTPVAIRGRPQRIFAASVSRIPGVQNDRVVRLRFYRRRRKTAVALGVSGAAVHHRASSLMAHGDRVESLARKSRLISDRDGMRALTRTQRIRRRVSSTWTDRDGAEVLTGTPRLIADRDA